jgi:hypothetical protein
MKTNCSLSIALVLACLSAIDLTVAAEPAASTTQEAKKDYDIWFWTIGPRMGEELKSKGERCSAEQMMDFYGASDVMYFDGLQPHTPEVAKRLARADKLVLSFRTEHGTILESLGPCPNLKGIILDDFSTHMVDGKTKPDQLAKAHRQLKARDPRLNLYAVVYTMHFDKDFKPFLPYIDVVSLWVWRSKDLADLDRHLERCRKIFPGKPIVLGLYMYEWAANRPMPMDLLQMEFRKARDYARQGLISGYQVLSSYRVEELKSPQALWVRDFTRAR